MTACVDCNNGKGSSNPESELVKDVSAASALYIAELQEKMAPIRERLTRELQYIATFSEQWGSYEFDGKDVPLPPTWRATLRRFEKMGVPIVLVCYAIEIAMGKQDVSASETFRYMCGVVYRTIENEVKA